MNPGLKMILSEWDSPQSWVEYDIKKVRIGTVTYVAICCTPSFFSTFIRIVQVKEAHAARAGVDRFEEVIEFSIPCPKDKVIA